MSAATMNMPKQKSKRTFLNVKVSRRALQLARIVCAYEEDLTLGDLMSDILEPLLLKRVEKHGAPVPEDPDQPK